MSELQIIVDHLDRACCPEDVFGSGDDPSIVYKKLARVCHPDRNPTEPRANDAFQRLNALKLEADDRIKRGIWGKRLPLTHCIPLDVGKYKVRNSPRIGDITDIYAVEGKVALIKVARSHEDNDLLRAEAESLKILSGITTTVKDGVPELFDSFKLDGVWKRQANVITAFPGFITAQEVHAKLDLVDKRSGVWMFKRMLSLLTWAHHFKLIHGAILPSHVLFYPDNDGNTVLKDPRKHSIRLIDWCYSVNFTQRTRLSSWVPAWKDQYAPELLAKNSIGPWSDIYMAAKLLTYLCGTLWMPELGEVLKKCLKQDPKERYQKSGEVLEDWKEAAIKAYGKPKWQEFNVPQ